MGDRDEPSRERKIQRSKIVRRPEPSKGCGQLCERGVESFHQKNGSEIFPHGVSG